MTKVKWAKVNQGVIDVISYYPDLDVNGNPAEGWLVVDSSVFAGFILVDGEWLNPAVEHNEYYFQDISSRQFFQLLAVRGIITEAEALAAVRIGKIPEQIDVLIDQLPEDSRFSARMLISGASSLSRQHPLTETIRVLFSWDESQTDQFWRDAALL